MAAVGGGDGRALKVQEIANRLGQRLTVAVQDLVGLLHPPGLPGCQGGNDPGRARHHHHELVGFCHLIQHYALQDFSFILLVGAFRLEGLIAESLGQEPAADQQDDHPGRGSHQQIAYPDPDVRVRLLGQGSLGKKAEASGYPEGDEAFHQLNGAARGRQE